MLKSHFIVSDKSIEEWSYKKMSEKTTISTFGACAWDMLQKSDVYTEFYCILRIIDRFYKI